MIHVAAVLGLLGFVAAPHASAVATESGSCELPASLQREVRQQYPSDHLITLADLSEHDRAKFVMARWPSMSGHR